MSSHSTSPIECPIRRLTASLGEPYSVAVAADFFVGHHHPIAGPAGPNRVRQGFASSKLLSASCRLYSVPSFNRCANGVGHVECLPLLFDRYGFAIARGA